ncbi:MAG: hypothetical protein AAFQ53_09105 [Bacteroidota bacterium]
MPSLPETALVHAGVTSEPDDFATKGTGLFWVLMLSPLASVFVCGMMGRVSLTDPKR